MASMFSNAANHEFSPSTLAVDANISRPPSHIPNTHAMFPRTVAIRRIHGRQPWRAPSHVAIAVICGRRLDATSIAAKWAFRVPA